MVVVPINSRVIPTTPEPIPEVISELESLLEMARSGELVGVAIGLVHPGDLTSWRRAGRQVRALFGVLELMKYDMCRSDFED